MAADQKNFGLFTYVDDDGVSWNKRGEIESVRQAVDGNAAAGAHQIWRDGSSASYKARKIIYQDPTTFRTKAVLFYTAAAYGAVVLQTDTLTFPVEGEATGVVYTAVQKVPEHKPGQPFARHLIDHA